MYYKTLQYFIINFNTNLTPMIKCHKKTPQPFKVRVLYKCCYNSLFKEAAFAVSYMKVLNHHSSNVVGKVRNPLKMKVLTLFFIIVLYHFKSFCTNFNTNLTPTNRTTHLFKKMYFRPLYSGGLFLIGYIDNLKST